MDLCSALPLEKATEAYVTTQDTEQLLQRESSILLNLKAHFAHDIRVSLHEDGFPNCCKNTFIA